MTSRQQRATVRFACAIGHLGSCPLPSVLVPVLSLSFCSWHDSSLERSAGGRPGTGRPSPAPADADPGQARQVRDWIRSAVTRHHCPVDPADAALAVSELYANAVMHGPAGGRGLAGHCPWSAVAGGEG